jgi:hypothetical protein
MRNYIKTSKGYRCPVLVDTRVGNRVYKIEVTRKLVANYSSSRGAYREVWAAEFGSHTGTGETRDEAVAEVLYRLAQRGIKEAAAK